ncbi:unnamed protein product [Calypogeia fissa]
MGGSGEHGGRCRITMGVWILALLCVGQVTEARRLGPTEEFHSSLSMPTTGASRSLSFLVPTPQTVLTYHNGPLLSSGSIPVYVIWYGSFSNSGKGIIEDFFASFTGSGGAKSIPTVGSWWGMTAGYVDNKGAGVSQSVHLAGEVDDSAASLGTSITEQQVETLVTNAVSAKSFPADANAVYFVFTAENIQVETFCSVCGSHNVAYPSASTDGQELLYAWVGNSATQCPGQCAWPFAKASYGPPLQLTPPNGDVGIDGMIITIATLIAGTATDPYGTGWYQGDISAPLECATACSGIYGAGAYPGDPGQLYVAPGSDASFNAVGANGRQFLLPALWLPSNSTCTPPPLS